MNGGMLPDGTTTENDKKYIEAWRKFAAPICKACDLELYAFDPDIAVRSKDRPRPKSLTLPRWFVHRINAVLANGTFNLAVQNEALLEACRQALTYLESQIEWAERMGRAVAEDTLEVREVLRAAIAAAEESNNES